MTTKLFTLVLGLTCCLFSYSAGRQAASSSAGSDDQQWAQALRIVHRNLGERSRARGHEEMAVIHEALAARSAGLAQP